MGPTNCDYSLLSADTRCNPTCSMENLANGTDQRWVDLRKCFDQNAPHHSGSTKTPVPVWNQDTCASDECERRFRDFASDCRACNTEIEFASFLSLAAKNLVLCREAATSCDSVIGSVRDACCAGVDCASDGYPTICSYSSGLRHFGGSLCQEAVQEAEEVCPLHLLNDTRLQGLYVDCGGNIATIRNQAQDWCTRHNRQDPWCKANPAPPPPRPMPPRPRPAGHHGASNTGPHVACTGTTCSVSNEMFWGGCVVLVALAILWLTLLCTRKTANARSRRQRINTASFGSSIYDTRQLSH